MFRQLEQMESRQLIERRSSGGAEAVYRLSAQGRLVALGGYDPVVEWGRRWDGRWRLVLFDLPQTKASARAKLRRFLQSSRFGYLQNSVWISPDPLDSISRELSATAADVESLITMEARPAAGESDADIVAGAWNFQRINRGYERCLEVLAQLPTAKPRDPSSAEELLRWARLEKRTWQNAVDADPLLPTSLLPAEYLGTQAWKERIRVLAKAGQLIQ